jgi:hypothetical protein
MLQRMSFAEENQHRRGAHNGCGAAGEICTNPHCDKDTDSIFPKKKLPIRKPQLT